MHDEQFARSLVLVNHSRLAVGSFEIALIVQLLVDQSRIAVWNLDSGNLVTQFQGHTAPVEQTLLFTETPPLRVLSASKHVNLIL